MSQLSKKLNGIFSNKKVYLPFIWIILILIWISIFWPANYSPLNYITKRLEIPKVIGANFSINYRKIPFDTTTLEINFSSNLSSDSINNKTITLNPFIEWKTELKNWNTIIYKLNQKLEIWQEYSLTISDNVKWEYWRSIGKSYNYIFEAISWAKVTKILPENILNDISQNLLVLFNIPLIPLTSLDNKDKLPCPVTITPKIDGKCKWTWWNVVEFIPTKYWEGSTEYKVTVESSSWLLYPLKEKKEISFKTPVLQFILENSFSPRDWINFISNYPVNQVDIEKNLTLKDWDKILPAKLISIEWSETRFSIKPVSGNYFYWKYYSVSIEKWIKPKYWNIISTNSNFINSKSVDFTKSIEIYQNVISSTWTILDTNSFSNRDKIPFTNNFFKITFDEVMTLNKDLFVFLWPKWKSIPFDLKYWSNIEWWQNWKKIEKEDKHILILSLKENLLPQTSYSFKILKKSNPNLIWDETYIFKTVSKLELKAFEYQNNTLGCAYFNNDLSWLNDYWFDYNASDSNQNWIKTIPYSKVRWITKDIQDYSTKQFRCSQKLWTTSYLVNLRLNPFTDYSIIFSWSITDAYNNKLNKEYKYSVKSWDISNNDKYIYSSFTKRINVIPSEYSTIIDIQGINIDKANIVICEMDIAWYYRHLNHYYEKNYSPTCIKSSTKEVELKNKFWTMSHNIFNIEKDILWDKIWSPIFLISGNINSWNNNWRSFDNLIIKSNLSLALESANNKKILLATSLDWIDLPSDLQFEWFKKLNNAWIESVWKINAKWDNNKKVYEIPDNYDIIVAKNIKYYSVINKNTDEASNYDFKYIAWQDSSIKDFLYLYTERPIYKPGDTVFFKWMLREFSYNWYHKSTAGKWKIKIMDSNYVFFKELEVIIDKNSNFSGKFELPKEMSFWGYSFEFYKDWNQESIYNDAKFFVEEYKKPVFKINANTDKKDYVLWEKATIDFDWEYYFWGKLSWAVYNKSIISQNYFFDAKDYSSFQFGIWWDNFNCVYWGYCNYYDNTEYSWDWILNSNWNEKWEFQFPKNSKDENNNNLWERIYSFSITITDPDTKKQVTKTTEAVLHTTDAYVWLDLPYYTNIKDWIKLSGVILNHNAQVLPNKKVKIELIKREWKSIKKQWVDWIFYNEYNVEEKTEWKIDMASWDNWEFWDKLIPNGAWEYEVRATYTWENNKSFVSSNYIYVAWEEIIYWWENNNSTTDLIADKSILKIWDKAEFTLKSPVKTGKILVTVEKDDWILDYFTQDIKSTWERISIPVLENYYPNFYVKVFLIWKENKNPLPIYKRALSVIKVVTDYKNIKVTIKPEKNHYLPGEKVKLNIKTTTTNWDPVAYANWSISIVDESLLALKWNPKKNPYAFFYDMKRYLWVYTYLSLFNLVDKLEIKDISDWEKWWAWEWAKWWDSKKKRWVFKDTAFWQADYTTDANWNYSIITDSLPDNLTTWVIESVASTPLDNKVWVWEATIVTTKKVIVNDNIPRFLWSNDRIILSPVVFNKTGKNSTFKVTLSADNLIIIKSSQEIKINNWEQKTVEFEVKVKDIWVAKTNENIFSKINIKAESLETNDIDEVEKFLNINETSTKETVSTVGKTDSASYTEKIDLTNINLNSSKLTINYAPTILSNITSSVDFLASFPYWCLEQKQSAILPSVYFKKLYNSVNLPFDLTKKMVKVWVDNDTGNKEVSQDEIIKNYIAESVKFQQFSWGFSYWSNDTINSYPSFHLTSIIVKWMSSIKSIWYTINEISLNNAINYLKNRFYTNYIEWCSNPNEYNNFCKYSESQRLDSIDAILEYNSNDYEAYKMWKLISFKDEDIGIKITKIWTIAKLLNVNAISENDKKALKDEAIKTTNSIIAEYLVYNPRWAFLGKDNNNSRIINTANFIWVVSDIWLSNFKDIEQIIDNMNRWIISEKKNWSFGSTQDSITVIKNLTKYIVSSGELKDLKSNIKVILNSEIIDEKNIDDKNKLDSYQIIIWWNKLKVQNDFIINKLWNGKVYYDLSLSYYLPLDKVKARDEWFYLEQSYFDYNEYHKIDNLKKIEWNNYLTWWTDYKDLKYPKNTTEYLTPTSKYKIWQLVLVYNKIVTSEPRDQVAYEWFIPSGSELINTNLDTESKSLKFPTIFNREEFRDDKYFWYINTLDSWLYEFKYVLRMTHAGSYNLKPSQISEFYKPETFWRNKWRLIEITK